MEEEDRGAMFIIHSVFYWQVISVVTLLALMLSNYRAKCLTKGFKTLLYVCTEMADFKNGNTDGTYDEGEVVAVNMIREAQKISRIDDYQ